MWYKNTVLAGVILLATMHNAGSQNFDYYTITFHPRDILNPVEVEPGYIRLKIVFELEGGESSSIYETAKSGPPWTVKIGRTQNNFPNILDIINTCIYFYGTKYDSSFIFKEQCQPLPSKVDSGNNLHEEREAMPIEEYWNQRRISLVNLLATSSASNFKLNNIEEKVRNFFEGIPDELVGINEIRLYAKFIIFSSEQRVQLIYKDYFSLYQTLNSSAVDKINRYIVSSPDAALELFDAYRLLNVDHQPTAQDTYFDRDYVYTLSYLAEKATPKEANYRTGEEIKLLSEDCAKRYEMHPSNFCALTVANIFKNNYYNIVRHTDVKNNLAITMNNLSLLSIRTNGDWVNDICSIWQFSRNEEDLRNISLNNYVDLNSILSSGACSDA